jgi:hypothetical protein
MGDLEPIFWLNSKDAITEIVDKALRCNESTKVIKDGQKWLNIISNEREKASRNISNLLIQ